MSERNMKRLLNSEADALIRERKGAILKAQIKNTGTDAEPSFRHGFLSVLSAAAAGLLIVSLFAVCLIPVAKKAYEDAHRDVGAASGQTVTGAESAEIETRKAVELSEYRTVEYQAADLSSQEEGKILDNLYAFENYKKENVPDKTETVFGKEYSLHYEWTQNIFKRGHGADMYWNGTEGAFAALWFDEVTGGIVRYTYSPDETPDTLTFTGPINEDSSEKDYADYARAVILEYTGVDAREWKYDVDTHVTEPSLIHVYTDEDKTADFINFTKEDRDFRAEYTFTFYRETDGIRRGDDVKAVIRNDGTVLEFCGELYDKALEPFSGIKLDRNRICSVSDENIPGVLRKKVSCTAIPAEDGLWVEVVIKEKKVGEDGVAGKTEKRYAVKVAEYVGAASGQTMTGEETPHAGTSADPDGSTDDKQQTENPETNSDNTAGSAEIETSKTDLISAEEFAGYIIRERNGEELDTKEIEKVKEYIDNTYLGIDVEYSRATGDGIDELLKRRGVDGSVPEAHILLYTDLKRLGLREEYGYPKLDLQTVCDIVNESDSFEEVLEGLGRAEKFFSASWRSNGTGMAGYTYDIKNSGDKCYERIFIDMDRKCVIYERNITDRESRDYHNSFGFYLFNEDTGAGRTGSITVDEVLKGLEYCVNHRLPGDL